MTSADISVLLTEIALIWSLIKVEMNVNVLFPAVSRLAPTAILVI